MDHAYTFEQQITAFWSKVERTEGCWIWKGSVSGVGYGQIAIKGKRVKAHRFSFFIANGVWPKGDADHICREKLCVRPDHLRDVTHKENMNYRLCCLICKRGHRLEDPNLYYYMHYGIRRRRCLTCMNMAKEKVLTRT